jgi:hypothetical protein
MRKNVNFDLLEPSDCFGDECCCKCAFHHNVYKHCAHMDRPGKKCICDERLPFSVCYAPEMNMVQVFPNHGGGCELFTTKFSVVKP